MKSKISIIIITKNEEKNIIDCLESIKWANEIILVDNSSDPTVKLAKKYTKKIYKLDASFKEKRKFGLKKAKNEWILFLDADERIGEELAKEIKQILEYNKPQINGYLIPFKHIFLGKWLKYGGWYPSYLPRLARKDKCSIKGQIHERLHIKGKVRRLKQPVIHYSDKSLHQRIIKTNCYTTLQAQEMFDKGIKFSYIGLILLPSLRFYKRYFLQLGFLDGSRGFIRAVLLAYTSFIMYSKLFWLYKNGKQRAKI